MCVLVEDYGGAILKCLFKHFNLEFMRQPASVRPLAARKCSVKADNGLQERGAPFGDVLDFDLGFDLCDVT